MKSIVSLGAILALAGAAVAGPFSIGTVDASGGLVAGGDPSTGLDWNGGVVYEHAFGGAGNTDEPGQALMGAFGNLQADTYLTIDHGPIEPLPGFGGAVAGAGEAPFINPADPNNGYGSGTGYRGAWFVSGPFVDAVEDPVKGWQLFVGQISLQGGSLSGRISVAFAEPGDTEFSTIVGDLNYDGTDVNTWDVMTHDITGRPLAKFENDGRGYAWVVKQVQYDDSATPGDTPLGGAVTYQIWLQNVVPTPGAMGLLGVAGLAAIRRRR